MPDYNKLMNDPEFESKSQIDQLKAVIKRLRAKDGCPWDREQTHGSLKSDMLEEATEVICGINVFEETGNGESMKDELGDLLLQVVMQAEIASEEGLFDFEDIAENVKAKMVRRHPHVFGDVVAENTEQVLKNWADIKAGEKTGKEWMDEKIPDAYEEAEKLLLESKAKKLAKLGDTSLCMKYADAYYYGEGTAMDSEKALYWYKKAADAGDAKALCLTGYCFRKGIGCDADPKAAFEAFGKSADMGFAMAMYNLGICFKEGLGCDIDKEMSEYWFKCAEENGYKE